MFFSAFTNILLAAINYCFPGQRYFATFPMEFKVLCAIAFIYISFDTKCVSRNYVPRAIRSGRLFADSLYWNKHTKSLGVLMMQRL